MRYQWRNIKLWPLLFLFLTACDSNSVEAQSSKIQTAPPAAVQAEIEPEEEIPSLSMLQQAQAAVASVVVPTVVAIQDTVQSTGIELKSSKPKTTAHPAAIKMIVDFEVISRDYYNRRLSGIYYPGGASGPTFGIGYDGGHQTRRTILDVWAEHDQVERIAETAGISGPRTPQHIPKWKDIRVPWEMAYNIYVDNSLPLYEKKAIRAFGEKYWYQMPTTTTGALTSLVYNRGGVMEGDARREMRTIRDVCLPNLDQQCVARELRAMCRIWVGKDVYTGLCRRRNAEADVALLPAS